MKTVILAMSLAAALAAYWIEDTWPCWFDDSTDQCVGCVEECLERGEQ